MFAIWCLGTHLSSWSSMCSSVTCLSNVLWHMLEHVIVTGHVTQPVSKNKHTRLVPDHMLAGMLELVPQSRLCEPPSFVIDTNISGRNVKEMTAAAPRTTYVRKARVTVTQT